MNVEEFLSKAEPSEEEALTPASVEAEEDFRQEQEDPEELDVQKVVVEELAADKAKLDEKVDFLRQRISNLEIEVAGLKATRANLESRNRNLDRKLSDATARVKELETEVADLHEKEFDLQERNPNALALLDRDEELPDRFPGETRDQVIEVVREARDRAEAEGRVRRAQLLESVLVANEPNGGLYKRRAALEKFFKDNGNILSGPVIAELERCGISYKKGEEYLLPSEIIKRTY